MTCDGLLPLRSYRSSRVSRTNEVALLSEAENHIKIDANQQLLSDCRFALRLQLRWRPLAPRKAALAAPRAAGMPVRRPRRPGGCRLGSRRSRRRARLELRRRARAAAEGAHRQGMSPPGRSLGRLVGRSVGSGRAFDFSCWCAMSGVVCGGCGSGFSCPRIWILWASRLCSRLVFCRGRCMCVPFGTTPSSSCASLLVTRSLRLSRLGSRAVWNRLWLDEAARCYHARAASARGARCAVRLFRWMGVWGVLVGLIGFSGFWVRPAARPPAPSTAPPPTCFGGLPAAFAAIDLTPLPGRTPSATVPHRPASLALCPFGHAAYFPPRGGAEGGGLLVSLIDKTAKGPAF